ncbi:hypothetical protein Zmor_010658 [Zophobas morio]|uniref:Transposable element P transposase-like RNase H domain-containing protein n=1 Tax=Zophobas morio TaxID=2755281 RepID=A0AA38IS70_9CUCU|nr:hypothetical protein Zmor_010658 [Zophobas morio]
MAIKPGLQFDNSSGEVIGKPTLKNSGDKDSDEYASHALVFMLAGVTTRWKQTIGYHFTGNTYSATEANEIILSILKKAHSIKLDVCAII